MSSFINKALTKNDEVFYKELKVKHLKTIYKTLIGEDPDPEVILINFNNILQKITNLPIQKIKSLDFISYLLLLLEIRKTSIGGSIFAELQNSNTKIEINIDKIKEQILEIYNNNCLPPEKNNKNLEVQYCLPTFKDLITINKQKDINSILIFFIDKLVINNVNIDFKNTSIECKNTIFDQIPAKTTSTIIKNVVTVIENFNNVNLLSYITDLKNVVLPLNLNIKNLIILLKFLFGEQLLSLYENIFALCKLGNFTPEYIENCSPGEYFLLIKKLELLNKNETSSQPSDNFENVQDDFENELDSINPYKSSDLPPITSKANFSDLSP
jgi:hypothetical protein